MSVAELSVDVLAATLRLPAELPAGGSPGALNGEDASRWLARLQAGLADIGLARAFAAADLPPGHWFLRCVELPVILDPARPEIALIAEWAERLALAVRRTALAGGPHVVHYPDDEAPVRDVVYGLVTGDVARAWAWSSAGSLLAGDPDPAARPRDALLAVAARHPHTVLTAVLDLLRRPGGLAALDRLLGPAGWVRLARPLAGGVVPDAGAEPSAFPGARPMLVESGPAARVRTLAARIVAGSAIAGQLRRSPLRPAHEVLQAWALLVVADADPGSLCARGRTRLVAEVAARLAPSPVGGAATAAPDRPAPAPALETGRGARPGEAGTEPVSGEGPGPRSDAGHPGPLQAPAGPRVRAEATGHPHEQAQAAVEDEAGWPTGWAGLAFLLAAAADAGLPAAALDEPLLGARPLRWLLFTLAGLLVPAAPDDPARLLLAGLTPDRAASVTREPPPDEDEAARLAELAAAWARAVAARLSAAGAEHPDSPDGSAAVIAVARRPGLVTGGPGWLEVQLPLSSVDLAIRRAGLDLDPGWVPWLGTVIRYRYA
jgi:hypothetical protein